MWKKPKKEWVQKILVISSQLIPGCFDRLGTGNKEKGISAGVHTPRFNIDENAIEIGMGIMAWLGSSID